MSPTVTARPTFREALLACVEAGNERLFRSAAHLLGVEGKSIRPRCVRLMATAANPELGVTEAHERLAQAVELLHVGSLIHDDILDEAATRRGVTAVHVEYGPKAAVLAGDYLLSKSCGLIASLEHHHLNARMAEVLSNLCEGEFVQDEQLYQLDVTLEEYLSRMALKTSGPFELACEGAVIVSGLGLEAAAIARRFGHHLGRLFQMFDDLVDWFASAQVAGKPVGQDLLAGSLTLPVLAALAEPEVGLRVRAALTPFPAEIDRELRAMLFRPEVFARAVSWLEQEAEEARQCLAILPDSPARVELDAYLDRLVEQARGLRPLEELPTLGMAAHAV